MENHVICIEHGNPLIAKMFLIKTLKYGNSTTILKILKALKNILRGKYNLYQNYIFINVY